MNMEADPTIDALLSEGMGHYECGEYTLALACLQLAAACGASEAAELVGFMYLVGQRVYGPGVPVDLAKARKWLHVAALHGSRAAVFPLRALGVAEPMTQTT